jgi:hypothetical protein
MNIRILKLLQKLIFSLLLSGTICADQYNFYNYLRQIEQEKNEHELHDAKLSEDLWNVVDSFYKKMLETTALYFTGMMINSDQFYKEIILTTNKHLLYASHIIAQYLPKLFQNQKIHWHIKVKKCAYASAFLIILAVWIKEVYQPHAAQHGHPLMQPTNPASSYFSPPDLQHRPRPSL